MSCKKSLPHLYPCSEAVSMAKQRRFQTVQSVIVPFPKTFTDTVSPSSHRFGVCEKHDVRLYGYPRIVQRLVAVHNVSNQNFIHWIVEDGPEMSEDSPKKSLYCNKQRIEGSQTTVYSVALVQDGNTTAWPQRSGHLQDLHVLSF